MLDSIDNLNQVMAALQQLQLENEILWESLRELQTGTSQNPPPAEPHPLSAPSPTIFPSYPYVLEPTLSLPDKFNGTRDYLRGFINQIRLKYHPFTTECYASDFSHVGLVGTLLSGWAQASFAPLFKTSSSILDNFLAFLAELDGTFKEKDRRRMALTKLYIPYNKALVQAPFML